MSHVCDLAALQSQNTYIHDTFKSAPPGLVWVGDVSHLRDPPDMKDKQGEMPGPCGSGRPAAGPCDLAAALCPLAEGPRTPEFEEA